MVAFSVKFETRRLLKRLEAMPEIVREESKAFSEEMGEIAVSSMQETILRSGTEFSRAARKVGLNKGPGRYRTGAMFNSIDYRVESGQKLTRLVFGYLRNPQDYFDIQEGYENPKGSFKNIFRATYSSVDGSLRLRKDGQPIVRKRMRGGHKNTETIQAMRQALRDIDEKMPALLKKYRSRITRRTNRA